MENRNYSTSFSFSVFSQILKDFRLNCVAVSPDGNKGLSRNERYEVKTKCTDFFF